MNRYERLLRRAYRQLRDVRADGGGDLEGDDRGQAPADDFVGGFVAALAGLLVLLAGGTILGAAFLAVIAVVLLYSCRWVWRLGSGGGEP